MMGSKSIVLLLCGLACISAKSLEGRIVGGSEAGVGQFPYQISLRRGNSHMCGGSILDETTILTAAHCVYGALAPFYKVVVGTNSLKEGGDSYAISKLIAHKGFDQTNGKDDIAIIKLKQPIQYKKNVKPIKLTTKDSTDNEDCILSGWGTTSFPGSLPTTLQYIRLKTIDNAECKVKQVHMPIFETQVCTFTKYGQGACGGDSGGPLVNDDGEQIGVVSWGTPCGVGEPDVFTKTFSYLDWIAEHRV